MRVLWTVSSWPTHYASMVPLGWALQASGHEVRVLCTPSQVEPVGGAGLTPVPILDSIDPVLTNRLQYYWEAVHGHWPYPWPPLHPLTGAPLQDLDGFDVADFNHRVRPALAERAARSFDAAVEYAKAWRPSLVLHDPANIEGILVARSLGVPAVLCLWGPVGTDEPEHMRIVPEDISGSFHRHGIGTFDLDMIEQVVDPCPESLLPPTRAKRLPVRYTPYNGRGVAPPWLLDTPDRPRVCVSWSTALTTMSGPRSNLLPLFVEALAGSPFDVVITATARDAAALPALPPSMRVEHLPVRLVLPHCAAIAHHGGSGTTMTAVAAGVPQLAVTFAAEQARGASRLAATGAGVHVPGHLVDAETIRRTFEALVHDGAYRRAANVLRTELLHRPSPVEFVAALESLAR